MDIQYNYKIQFLKRETHKDHLHFLIRSVTINSFKKIVRILKNIAAIEIFFHALEVSMVLGGGSFGEVFYYKVRSSYSDEKSIL
ncbi:transposase [Maribacter arcticus]|uniref:transposase n=1 Tax=Maribacter arcticus TaxID=561365 RepID=UPI0009A875B8